MLAITLTSLVIAAAIFAYATSSDDLLDISVARAFGKILLKYVPGYTAPLRGDSTGAFHFKEIKLEGDFRLTILDLATFSHAVGSSSNPFLLNAKVTPLVISILADPRCPIKPLGAVNTRNVIKLLRPFDAADDFKYVARFGAIRGQRQKRGVEFAVTVDVLQGAELIMQSELWFLAFLPKSYKPIFTGEVKERAESVGKKVESITMTAEQPRLWAASCKDYNPIHISNLAARLFGQKSIIAHGNYVAALVIERLGWKGIPVVITPEFLRPVTLPGTYDIVKHDGGLYTVEKGGKPHIRLALSST